MDTSWGFAAQREKVYVVQTHTRVIQRCLLMTTDPGDLVFDPTCGSGTTAFVAEQWGRRWITCDTSRVALTLARQRLMTAVFDYYELAHPEEGVGSGFKYKTVPHVTLKSIANNPDIKEGMTREQIDAAIARHAPQETLYDQPFVDKKKTRVSGPFTVEAVPAPAVKSLEELVPQASPPASAPHRPVRDVSHSRGYLPHLRAEGGTYFVTFRLADTLPAKVLQAYEREREEIVKRAEQAGRELSVVERKRLAELHSQRVEGYLDAGHGSCVLKDPEVGQLVANTLRHFDGERYHLHAWVVMPNHVHVVVTPGEGYTLSSILHSWKSFTAHEVKKVLRASRLPANPSATAPFWQRESYDHLVRDEEDLARVCDYTIQNPVKAGLCAVPESWPFSSAAVTSAEGGPETGGEAGGTPAVQDDASIARSGETLRQGEWRDELLRTGIRGKAGQHIRFARLEPLPGCRHLHADGETRPNDEGADRVREPGAAYSAQRVVVSFGPEHAPLEQRQVAQAIEEAQTLVPRPRLIVFAAFQFDPEAARDIDETHWPGVTLLKAQMNADLLTDDLKKKRASNESFWLIGQPDVQVERIAQGKDQGKLRVSVHGFDYYNTKTGGIESGGEDKIAVWLLDTDYDGRSLYPRQVFFPMAGEKDGWARLARNLKAEIDEELIEAYRGTVSLPFEAGQHKRIAVKIVDDRGIESLKVLGVE
jgi:REP element-mobilizing transposase RayT